MVPKFGLLGSLQSNNDPSFIAKANQELAFSLGIEYFLYAKRKNNKKGRERQIVQFFYMCNLDSNIYFNAEDRTI